MSGATAKVTVVGSINADMRVGVERFPGPGETLAGGEATLTPGGKGANQALAAARCGVQVAMVGAVSELWGRTRRLKPPYPYYRKALALMAWSVVTY